MRKIILSGLLLLVIGWLNTTGRLNITTAQAQTSATNNLVAGEIELVLEASAEADASGSAESASPSAEIEQKIQEKIDKDVTDPSGETKNKLVAYLDDNPPEPLSWNNFLEHAIRNAVKEGVQPNVIVLIILFPLIASLIAASRHIIGLRGFGIYIPTVLSIALASTGVIEGMVIFLAIILTAMGTKKLVKKAKLPYLPRTGLIIWTISLGILGLFLLVAPLAELVTLMSVNIFPILILVLLSENFLDAQARTKQSDAIIMAAETLALAFFSSLLIRMEPLQQFALLEPELLLASIALINILVGKFVGLRITERLRFRSIIEE